MRRAPQDRYRGVGDLVDDVRSHIALRPVAARSGSAGYTIGRYLRRHRVATAAAAAALLAIVAGGGAAAWQARPTAIERDVGLAEARRSESINRMLTVLFRHNATRAVGQKAKGHTMAAQTEG